MIAPDRRHGGGSIRRLHFDKKEWNQRVRALKPKKRSRCGLDVIVVRGEP